MRFLINIIRFFKTEFGKKVKKALTELIKIVTDQKPNKPQLRDFGKKYGQEAVFYGLMIGEDELIKIINNKEDWSEKKKAAFKKDITQLLHLLESQMT